MVKIEDLPVKQEFTVGEFEGEKYVKSVYGYGRVNYPPEQQNELLDEIHGRFDIEDLDVGQPLARVRSRASWELFIRWWKEVPSNPGKTSPTGYTYEKLFEDEQRKEEHEAKEDN